MNLLLEVAGLTEFAQGIENAQKKKFQFMRAEAKRGGNRARKYFIQQDMSGRPGIVGGSFKKGKQVFSFVSTGSGDVSVSVGISRGLRIHDDGHVFRPKKGEYLYIREDKQGRGTGKIVARVKQVTIPKRTDFRGRMRSIAPTVLEKVGAAGARAVQISIKQSMDRVIQGF